MKIKCIKCSKEFNLDKKDIKIQSFLGMREEYYECPLCKEKYVIVVHNIKTDKLRKKVEHLRFKIKAAASKGKNTKNDYDRLQIKLKELKKEMDKLNNK